MYGNDTGFSGVVLGFGVFFGFGFRFRVKGVGLSLGLTLRSTASTVLGFELPA